MKYGMWSGVEWSGVESLSLSSLSLSFSLSLGWCLLPWVGLAGVGSELATLVASPEL
jgi:hypothetical protein